jgi:CO dehydrogenase maturation factor
VDLLLVVVEPGGRAVETAASVRRMAEEIGVRQVAVIGNKVRDSEDQAFLDDTFGEEDYLGTVPFSDAIRRADREGLPLLEVADEGLKSRFRDLWDRVKKRATISQPRARAGQGGGGGAGARPQKT